MTQAGTHVRKPEHLTYTSPMPVTFEQPAWLLVLLLAVPAGIVGLRWFSAMSRPRAWSAVLARALLFGLLAAALAGASAVHSTRRMAVIAVVDVSDSVRQFATFSGPANSNATSARAMESVRAWLTRAASAAQGPDDLLGVVVFDGDSAAALLPRPVRSASEQRADSPAIFDDLSLDLTLSEGTNLEGAINFASALIPPDAAGRLLLVSDGNETQGDALEAARRLSSLTRAGDRASAIPVDVLPVAYTVENEVLVEAADVPPNASEGSAVTLRVVLNATQPAAGTLEVLYGDAPLDINGPAPGTGRSITLNAGRTVESIDVTLEKGRSVHRLRPVFTAADPASDRISVNNTAETFTITPGKGSVLLVDGVADAAPDSPGRTLALALERAGLEIEVVRPEALPRDLLDYQSHDLVILEDVASEEVPPETQRLLAEFVTGLGGGLVMVGGPDSFGAGGWKGTPIEPILPVSLDLPEQLLVPSAAVVLVIDNSGSMNSGVGGGLRSQQEIANQGAALAVETLDRTDLVSVIAFNSEPEVVVPLARNAESRVASAKVRSIRSGGGTNLYPALALAEKQLTTGEASKASVRHVIVLSDGRSEPPSANLTFEQLAQRMRNTGITVSTISVGDGADDQQLASIARAGGGQFHLVVDPNVLPRIFIKEVRVVRKPLIRETQFRPVDLRSGSTLIAGVPRPFEPLGGLVLTQKRRDPTVTNVLATPEGEPVLSTWFAGRGQVTAFTSDAHRWASQWINWPGYAALWTQIARQTARPSADRNGVLTTTLENDELILRFEAFDDDGAPIDGLEVPGRLFGPDGARTDVRLSQIGPGLYETRATAAQRGNYYAALLPSMPGRDFGTVFGGASRAQGAEFRATRSNIGLLQQIAQITGGRTLDPDAPEAASLYERGPIAPVRSASPIWQLLLLWALFVLVIDVGTRRVAWDRLLSKEVARELREQAAAAVKARSEAAAATVASLRKVADRASEDASAPSARPIETPIPVIERRPPARRARSEADVPPAAPDPVGPPPAAESPTSDASTTSGLLAAKRRAARRFDSDPAGE